jgi:gamma-glutamyltranspeptidase/glutathione hydrolase/leukotriene-C4 hydrolase
MTRHSRLVFLCSLFFFAFFVYGWPWLKGTRGSPSSNPQAPFFASERNPSFLVRARNGAVASENIRCSDIGVDVLKEGGNAVDAAVATTFCIGVVNMFS